MKKKYILDCLGVAALVCWGAFHAYPTEDYKDHFATFMFDAYLRDNGCLANVEGFITIDVISVIDMPSTTRIEVYKRLKSDSVSDPWTLVGSARLSDLPQSFIVSDPNTYNFYVAADYVQPQPVITNSVLKVNGFSVPLKPGTYAFPKTIIKIMEPTNEN